MPDKLTDEERSRRNVERVRRWRLRNPDARRKESLAKYGLTLDDFERMALEQDGCCAICGNAKKKLVVDHDHATGQVRGLLCVTCNGWLGFVEKYLPQAQAYLMRTT